VLLPLLLCVRHSLRRAACISTGFVVLLTAAGAVPQTPQRPSTGQVTAPAPPEPRQTADPIAYTLRFPAPSTGYLEVDATVPTGGRTTVELMMAVWTPGSYLIREYERHVEAVTARSTDGRPLLVEKTRKNRWRIQVPTPAPRTITVAYRVYAREMTVRTNWVDDSFAMLNGAATFLTLIDGIARPHDVHLVLPDGWKRTVTALPAAPGGEPDHYLARDYDTLVDSPIIAGNPSVHEFTVGGKAHFLVNAGDDSVWDSARSITDVAAIVSEWRRMWGFLPYPQYYFLNVLTDAGGGLEHANCSLLMTRRNQTRARRDYISWLSLVSHEFFHAWNVKRLHPIELGPFDYENENYTRSLWIAEGFTDYYGELALPRANLISAGEYLALLSERLQALQSQPGRLVQPLQLASYDAWIKEYRPDENSVNSTISYYTKGGAVAFLLDARIRRATGGARSLDDGMRLAYERYSGPRGYTTSEFRRTMAEVAGANLDEFFGQTVDSTEELDYAEALDWFGLQLSQDGPPQADSPPRAYLGIGTRVDSSGRLLVSEVLRGTPAWNSGVSAGDEVVSVGEDRLRPGLLEERLAASRPGDRMSLLVSRRDRLVRLTVTLGTAPGRRWTVERNPNATAEQKAHFSDWLGQQ
jgi:predicted metalloprotease with PDZ domain